MQVEINKTQETSEENEQYLNVIDKFPLNLDTYDQFSFCRDCDDLHHESEVICRTTNKIIKPNTDKKFKEQRVKLNRIKNKDTSSEPTNNTKTNNNMNKQNIIKFTLEEFNDLIFN